MTRRQNKVFISTVNASIVLTSAGNSIIVRATQVEPGFFDEHVTLEIARADAVRMYLWLQEEIGKEVVK